MKKIHRDFLLGEKNICFFWGVGGVDLTKKTEIGVFMVFLVSQMFHCNAFLVKAPPLGGFIVGRKQTDFHGKHLRQVTF